MLRIAIQRDGRLAASSTDFLRGAGLEFEDGTRKLLAPCRNFPLEILYVRDDDIPQYVAGQTADLGIIGQNVLLEAEVEVETALVLPFGYCALAVAVLKESAFQTIEDLANRTVATTYPNLVKKYFDARRIPVKTMEIAGSVEVTPALGICDAIVDIVSSGSTLILNDLRMVDVIERSQAVLIANSASIREPQKAVWYGKLMVRLQGVLAAQEYKYVMMNVREKDIARIIEIMPGLKSPTVSRLAMEEWVSIQSVIKESEFWETVERLKAAGACNIIVLPIEKLIC